ncbi:hypothetical protein [Xylanimonas protaetiae]|uniref:Uncharacterized protein n=1 Tax=Xylanimonas protaetiae TaxID=2509457 RepID=A0A4P6FGK0_9MICO|nr:hypothetical protein [Xylanimonas protaetiae]QAY69728.1 hypothetical protein ET471_06465 [Xylanimonas protaetiae]
MSAIDARQRRRARQVTYGMVAVLAVTAVAHLELWPLTSFRLFSGLRTGTGATYELIAVATDGTRTVVPTNHQLVAKLPQAAPDAVAAQVGAWLDDAGLAADALDVVVLERSTWELDPETLTTHETDRDVVLEVQP